MKIEDRQGCWRKILTVNQKTNEADADCRRGDKSFRGELLTSLALLFELDAYRTQLNVMDFILNSFFGILDQIEISKSIW